MGAELGALRFWGRRKRGPQALGCLLAAVLLGAALAPPPVSVAATQGVPTPGPCVEGVLPHGARSLICVPAAGWNGRLIVWAHGYVGVQEPLQFAQLSLPDGTLIPLAVQFLGFAFATTTYRANGLVVLEGLEDLTELIVAFPAVAGRAPDRVYIAGASEGALIATLLAERAPHVIHGAIAACGPIGDFEQQVQRLGDFRVLFDAYFPGVLPGSPISVPAEVADRWSDIYLPAVLAAMVGEPAAAVELMRVAGVAIDPADPLGSVLQSASLLLWYNVFGTDDARARLGGNPYDNTTRQYVGSANDPALNARVQRFSADPTARAALAFYRTSGASRVPVVVLHTTGDPVVPAAQPLAYLAKARAAGAARVTLLPVARWGHCRFTLEEAVLALAVLLAQEGGRATLPASRSASIQRRAPSVRRSIAP